MQFDIFNGDADGIFALHQFRLKFPVSSSTLITGVKRDIRLLAKLEEQSDNSLCVFDISLNSNLNSLHKILRQNNKVIYFDHHFAGDIPNSPLLETFIQTSATTCTSLIVKDYCKNNAPYWAVSGAFGDNLHQAAGTLAQSLGLTEAQINILQELGELFNYNGYGTTVNDLHFHPEQLYRAISAYADPFDFCSESHELETLRQGYQSDLTQAMDLKEEKLQGRNRVYLFPDCSWARRITGVFSNLRARERTDSAHAILTQNSDSTLRISVRAPLDDRRDADTLCNLFPTGGGRAAAAGINRLPAEQYDEFLEKFAAFYPSL